MNKFTATIAQAAVVRTITAVEAATVALNASEAFKLSGAGYNDKSMVKLVADVVCNEASVCAIEGNKVTKVGIKRNVVPFGVMVTLSNGMGRTIRVTNTSFGCRITERNPQGWTRTICTVGEVKEMLTTFAGAVKA